MRTTDVCNTREAFLSESRRQGYVIPWCPPLPGLDDLKEEDVIDEATVKSRAGTVRAALRTTDEKINQLCQQLKAALFGKAFLLRILDLFCGEITSSRSRSAPSRSEVYVNLGLDLDLDTDNLAPDKQQGRSRSRSKSPSSAITDVLSRIRQQIVEINNSLLAQVAEDVCSLDLDLDQDKCLPRPERPINSASTANQAGVSHKPGVLIASSRALRSTAACDTDTTTINYAADQGYSDILTQDSAPNGRGYQKPGIQFTRSNARKRQPGHNILHTGTDKPTVTCGNTPISHSNSNGVTKVVISGESGVGEISKDILPIYSSVTKSKNSDRSDCATGQEVTQQNRDFEDDEDPYDNVITLAQHKDMFRKKKINDLGRSSSSLSSKDNFLAVTSKNVSPSNVPTHMESSPQVGRHFQMLRLTSGYDFELEGGDQESSGRSTPEQGSSSTVNTATNIAGGGERSSHTGAATSDSSLSESSDKASPVLKGSKIEVGSKGREGLGSTDSGLEADIRRSPESRHHDIDSVLDQDESRVSSARLIPQEGDSTRATSADSPDLTHGEQADYGSNAPPRSGPENESLERSTLRDSEQHTTNIANSSSDYVNVSVIADALKSTVDHSAAPNAGEKSDVSFQVSSNANFENPSAESISTAPAHVVLPKRSPSSVKSPVPPPVAKKPARYNSSRKPAEHMSPLTHSASLETVQPIGHTTEGGPITRAFSGDTDTCNRESKRGSAKITPLVSKSPGSELSSNLGPGKRREGSVRGIVARFSGGDPSQATSATQPPPPVRRRSSGNSVLIRQLNISTEIDTSKDTDAPSIRVSQLPAAEVIPENPASLASGGEDSCRSEKEGEKGVEEGDEERERRVSIQDAVKHSIFAADAVGWPAGLAHPEPLDSPLMREGEGGAGVGELVERANSSLFSLNNQMPVAGVSQTADEANANTGSEAHTVPDPSSEALTKLSRDVELLPDNDLSEDHRVSSSCAFVEADTTPAKVNPATEQPDTQDLATATDATAQPVIIAPSPSDDSHHQTNMSQQQLHNNSNNNNNADADHHQQRYGHKPSPILTRDASFTSDQEVKDAIFGLDAILHDSLRHTSSSSSSAPTSPISLRRAHDALSFEEKAARRKSSTASFENWTINRFVTRALASTPDFFSDEDEDEEEDQEEDDGLGKSVASPPLTKRDATAKGSKDSGLCDDISLGTSIGSGELMATSSGLDLAPDGRIRDLRMLQHMAQCDEEEELEEVHEMAVDDVICQVKESRVQVDTLDATSVTSDIVYLPGSRGGSRIRALAHARDATEDEANEKPDSMLEDATLLRRPAHTHGDDPGSAIHPGHRARLSRDTSDALSMGSSVDEEDGQNATMDSSYDETDSARDGMLKMRQLLVKGVLDSEKVYLDSLNVLLHYKKVLENNSASTQPVISRDDVSAIFSDIETIHRIHEEFVLSLEPKVQNWHHEERIGEIFKIMISKFNFFGNYLTNYQRAVNTIHRCSQGSEQFQELAKKFVVTSTSTEKEISSLEDALFKPVQRVQRNTLVLHDLIKYTPHDHPDHEALQRALKLSQHILEIFAKGAPKTASAHDNRRLVKSSFLVELVNGVRKLRYIFLFSDILVCTKRETHRNNKVTFDPKWFTHLSQTTFDTKFDYTDDTKHSKREDIDQLKEKLRALKKELRAEMKKYDDKDKHRSLVSIGGATRVVEKLRKKISHYEAQLILASPKLPFKVALEGGKIYTLLMTTDYEREEWKEAIRSLSSRASQQVPTLSAIFVQDLINSVKETPQVNKIGSVLLQKDEDVLSGMLNVTIHKMNGLTESCDTYCCLEMDSFGHFFMKARTRICESSRDPAWNEDFELELESSQTIRFLCFRRGSPSEDAGDIILGRGALELSKEWLKGSFQEKTVSMNEISLVVSVRHTPAEKTMQRVPSRVSAAVFGVKIASCARREGKTVPSIVTACLQEVEKRGLDETGIYRVSGVTSELQRIKKLFDKNIRAGANALTDIDIHAVTGVLKLYFRELPEPLFTETSYQSFVDTLRLDDEETKAECMLSLLHSLPDTNYYTIVTLLEHLIKVARNVGENRMSIHNLSTIFGPTLLAPATSQTASDPMEMICKGAEQVMRQSGVVNYLLGLAVSGRSLRRSA